MKPNPEFLGQGKDFWAHIRSLSQTIGYSQRATKAKKAKKSKKAVDVFEDLDAVKGPKTIKVPTLAEVLEAMQKLTLSSTHLVLQDGVTPSAYARRLLSYFEYRADVLNNTVEKQLQSKDEAEAMYDRLKQTIPSRHADALNKQKGDKKTVAYLTAMVNMLVEAHAGGFDYDHNPMQLTTVTRDGKPLRTLARRVDGAFPSVVNPVAIWEIKEYYHTKTFGSRVADGVYETLLDGLELEEMRNETGIDVQHILIIDAHYTWWECGRSYLCRMLDMLHMGLVDEILFGREIEDRIPAMVGEWAALVRAQLKDGSDKPRLHGQTELI